MIDSGSQQWTSCCRDGVFFNILTTVGCPMMFSSGFWRHHALFIPKRPDSEVTILQPELCRVIHRLIAQCFYVFSHDDGISLRRNMSGCKWNVFTKVVLLVTCARVCATIYIFSDENKLLNYFRMSLMSGEMLNLHSVSHAYVFSCLLL
jgi:hypothetical protein